MKLLDRPSKMFQLVRRVKNAMCTFRESHLQEPSHGPS